MKYAKIENGLITQTETVGEHRGKALRVAISGRVKKMTSNTIEQDYIDSVDDWRILVRTAVSAGQVRVPGAVIKTDSVLAYTVRDKSAQELQAEAAALAAEQEIVDETAASPLDNVTFAQVDTYIDKKVTDLASAKDVLKKYGKAILILNKKLNL